MYVDRLLATIVMVIQLQAGKPIGSATGFFYADNSNIFLITNRHVVLDEKKGHRPDALRLKLNGVSGVLGKGVDFDVPLYHDSSPVWLTHPKYPNPPIDVVAIPLDYKALMKDHFLVTLSSANFLPDDLALGTGEDVMAIGFPRGLSDQEHNLPIARNAMISSAYGVPFQGFPLFLIDANMHPGMSGSPVFTRQKNLWQRKSGGVDAFASERTFLLGVHSATLGVELPTGQEPLGLATVWDAQVIEDIIEAKR